MKQAKAILMLVGLLFSLLGYSQKIFISGKEGNRKLVWSDFSGNVSRSSPFAALTHYDYHYKIENVKVEKGIVKSSDFIVTLEFNPDKSWVKDGKQTDELLKHEQGHFDIAIVCVKELVAMYKKRTLTAFDFNESVKELTKETFQKYKELEAQYDEETDHSKNKEQQLKWNDFIAKQLALYP